MLEDDNDVVGSGDVTMRIQLSFDSVKARGVLLWLFDASELLLLILRFSISYLVISPTVLD